MPFAEARSGAEDSAPILDRWGVWVPAALALVALAYAVPLYQLISQTDLLSPGFKVW